MFGWLGRHRELVEWLGIASAVMFVASLVIVPLLVVRIPADYFRRHDPQSDRWRARHPVVRWTLRLVKNFAGLVLLLAGVAMLVGPGQGLLTIAIGLMLLDFPGKRRLERRLIARPGILRTMNWMRRKAHRPPLLEPDPDPPAGGP